MHSVSEDPQDEQRSLIFPAPFNDNSLDNFITIEEAQYHRQDCRFEKQVA